MNTAALLCRNVIRYRASTWWQNHVMHRSWLPYRPTSQYIQPSGAVTHQVKEETRESEKSVKKNETEVLKNQVTNGQVVKIALGQTQSEDVEAVVLNVDKVLEAVEGKRLSTADSVDVLKRIRNLYMEERKTLTQHERNNKVVMDKRLINFLVELCGRTQKQPHNMLAILQPLLDISGEDTPAIRFLEEELMIKLSSMQFSTLFHVFVTHCKHHETELRRSVYSHARDTVLRRWLEISEPEQLLFIMNNITRRSSKGREKLQNKALTLTEKMDESQLVRLLKELSQTNQRNVPLLKNVFHHLKKVGVRADITQSKIVLHSVGNLKMYDEELLRGISMTLYSNINTLRKADPETLSSIIFSLMKLNYKYIELVDSIGDILMSKQEGMDLTEEQIVNNIPTDVLTAVIVSCASLNHMPKNWKSGKLLNMCVEKIKNSGDVSPRIWLNTVHALVILDAADESAVSSVLNDPDKREWDNLTSNMKLRDINFSAMHEMKSYEGPYLPEHFLKEKQIMKNKKPLFTDVVETLNKLLPGHKYFKSRFDHPRGLNVGIHMVVNAKGEPQPIDDFPADKDLPESMHWIAVEPLDFDEMTKCVPGPVGFKSLHIRHLKCLGYKVVEVPHTEWTQLTTEVKKVQYLTKKIVESIR